MRLFSPIIRGNWPWNWVSIVPVPPFDNWDIPSNGNICHQIVNHVLIGLAFQFLHHLFQLHQIIIHFITLTCSSIIPSRTVVEESTFNRWFFMICLMFSCMTWIVSSRPWNKDPWNKQFPREDTTYPKANTRQHWMSGVHFTVQTTQTSSLDSWLDMPPQLPSGTIQLRREGREPLHTEGAQGTQNIKTP